MMSISNLMASFPLGLLPNLFHRFTLCFRSPRNAFQAKLYLATRQLQTRWPSPVIASPSYSCSSFSAALGGADVLSVGPSDSSEVNPGWHIKVKGKILNLWGVFQALVSMVVAAAVVPPMAILAVYSDLTGHSKVSTMSPRSSLSLMLRAGQQRRLLDWMVHHWARISLVACFSRIRVFGVENLPPYDEAVIYVPNHTSFLDILVLSGFVPRPFKYLSKAEILKIPVIGWAMQMAKHVFLKRNDIQSTILCAETCRERLRDGNAMVLFAEGTRSPDGRLKSFKKGAFQMARDTGVRVVPVSIGNLHKVMPTSVALPISPIRDAFIKIHPPIEVVGKTVKQIKQQCFEAVNSGLPPYQQFSAGDSGSHSEE
eukprot:scaffold1046_cov162-Ochromonas_danica.AAC.61